MSDIFSFITTNWPGLLAIVTAVFVAIDKIVALTPTKSDDEIVAKVEEVLQNIGVLPKPPAA